MFLFKPPFIGDFPLPWFLCFFFGAVEGGVRSPAMSYPQVNVYIANWRDPPFSMGKPIILAIFNSKL